MTWSARIYVRELDRVFRRGSLLDAHIARFAVLYEDLRLEIAAASETSMPILDEIGVEHRRIYFARRSIGTLREMAEAVRLLSELPAFETISSDFDDVSAMRWKKALRFFLKWEPYIERIRHDFGGHFGLQPAVYAMEHLNDTPVVLEFKRVQGTDRVGPRLKFATELTAIAMRRHQVANTSRGHFRRMFVLANLGFNHAVRVVHSLTANFIFERFVG